MSARGALEGPLSKNCPSITPVLIRQQSVMSGSHLHVYVAKKRVDIESRMRGLDIAWAKRLVSGLPLVPGDQPLLERGVSLCYRIVLPAFLLFWLAAAESWLAAE